MPAEQPRPAGPEATPQRPNGAEPDPDRPSDAETGSEVQPGRDSDAETAAAVGGGARSADGVADTDGAAVEEAREPEGLDATGATPDGDPADAESDREPTRFRDRGQTLVAALLGIGVLGDLYAAFSYRAEITFRLDHLATSQIGFPASPPSYGDELPIVWVLAALTVALAVVFAGIALAIYRGRRAGEAALWAGGLSLLVLRLLLLAIAAARYETFLNPGPGDLDLSPASTRGQFAGAAVGAGALVAALAVASALQAWAGYQRRAATRTAAELSWRAARRPATGAPAARSAPSAEVVPVARWAALAAPVLALIAPVVWVGPVSGAAATPDGWTLVAIADGLLAVGAFLVAVLVVAVRRGRAVLRWTALMVALATAAFGWATVFVAGLYADAAMGPAAVDGYAFGWWAGIVAGTLSTATVTFVATALLLGDDHS